MIREYYEDEYLDTAISGCDLLNQIVDVHKTDPALAGELAIAALIYIHTGGEICSDNATIGMILKGHRSFVEKNAEKCAERTAHNRTREIEKEQLDAIAELLNQGYKQIEISDKLKIPKSTVSDKCRKIRKKFPELLREKNPKSSDILS